MRLEINSRVVQAKGSFLSSEVADETIILQLNSGVYFRLNESASAVWKHSESPIEVKDLLRLILARYEVPVETAERDLLAALSEMEETGLLRIDAYSSDGSPSSEKSLKAGY